MWQTSPYDYEAKIFLITLSIKHIINSEIWYLEWRNDGTYNYIYIDKSC